MSGQSPPTLKSSIKSWNWPWMSPQIWREYYRKNGRKNTVTGASTRWTFDSSTRISLALAQRVLTSLSLIISQFLSCSICLSKSPDMEKKRIFKMRLFDII